MIQYKSLHDPHNMKSLFISKKILDRCLFAKFFPLNLNEENLQNQIPHLIFRLAVRALHNYFFINVYC